MEGKVFPAKNNKETRSTLVNHMGECGKEWVKKKKKRKGMEQKRGK